MTRNGIRIGLLGAGRIGRIHGGNIAAMEGAILAAVFDPLEEAAHALSEETGATVRARDEILGAEDIDAVVIATPTDTHVDLIVAAARAGKAVFCEKPIDLSIERAGACLETLRAHKTAFMVGFNRRFDPSFAALKARLAAGEIGAVEMVSLTSRDPAPPPLSYIAHSGGLFRDMMIHDFDMARFLLDEEPICLYASASNLIDPAIGAAGDVDSALVVLRTGSGKLCQISNSRRASYGYDQRIEVHGASGMLRAGNPRKTTVERAGAEGFLGDPLLPFFLERYGPAYRAELAAFVDCLDKGGTMTPSGEDGLKALQLADAAARSAETGAAVSL